MTASKACKPPPVASRDHSDGRRPSFLTELAGTREATCGLGVGSLGRYATIRRGSGRIRHTHKSLVRQVATGKLPFPDERTELAIIGAVCRRRFPKYDEETVFIRLPAFRHLLLQCWAESPNSRPLAADVPQTLSTIVGQPVRCNLILTV